MEVSLGRWGTVPTVATKILSCQVNTTSRWGTTQLGISFGSIFVLFSNESSQGPHSYQLGEIPSPRLLMTAPQVPEQICSKTLLEPMFVFRKYPYLSWIKDQQKFQGGVGSGRQKFLKRRANPKLKQAQRLASNFVYNETREI